MENENPTVAEKFWQFVIKHLVLGIIVAVVAGLLVAYIAQEGRFAPEKVNPISQPQVEIPVSPIVNEKVVFLSDLTPQIIEAAGNNYCVGRDPVGDPPTCTGAKIEVQGTPFPHSLFAHAASTLIFDLNEGYDTFVTSIFLFGSQCGDGASFRIELDGKEVFSSLIINHGEIPYNIRIDVKYGHTLRLETHTGNNNDYLCDGTVWGEPYLISKP